MDDYVDQTMLDLDRFAIGQPVPRSEDPVLLRGEGHYADDISLPGQAYAVMVAQPPRARHHPRHRHRGGARYAGGARRLYGGGSGGRGDRAAAAAPGHEQSRRHADAEPSPLCAGDRKGPLCRRGNRRRRRRDPRPSERRRRGGGGRHRPIAGRHQRPEPRRHPARRCSTTTCPAMSGSISISATARRSPPPLPVRRM